MGTKKTRFVAGNAKLLRKINTDAILRIIRETQPISRVQIAKLTGLNKSTVSSIIGELLDEDLLFEVTDSERSVGRVPLNLSLRLGRHFVGAVDVDSPITRVGILDIDGSLRAMNSIRIDPASPEKCISQSIDALKNLCASLHIDHLNWLGVSLPGVIDSRTQILEFSPNLGWRKVDIGKLVSLAAEDIENVSVGNGANLSALAELRFGTHDLDLSNFVFLSVHRGIGSGMVIDSRLREGEYQTAGEFGHMVIYDGGEACQCGNAGCFEAYASDWATVNRYVLRKHDTLDGNADCELQDIVGLANQGDKIAIEELRRTGYYLGVGISNIIKAIDPHAIIIGGQVTQCWDLVYPEILSVVTKRAYFGLPRRVKILPTSLTVPPRLIGAATLAIEQMFANYGEPD